MNNFKIYNEAPQTIPDIQANFYSNCKGTYVGLDIIDSEAYVRNIAYNTSKHRNDVWFSNGQKIRFDYDALYLLVKTDGRQIIKIYIATDTEFTDDLALPNPSCNATQNYVQLSTMMR